MFCIIKGTYVVLGPHIFKTPKLLILCHFVSIVIYKNKPLISLLVVKLELTDEEVRVEMEA